MLHFPTWVLYNYVCMYVFNINIFPFLINGVCVLGGGVCGCVCNYVCKTCNAFVNSNDYL